MKAGLPDHSGLWGFARAVRMEYPGMPWLYSPWSVVGFVKVETVLELFALLLSLYWWSVMMWPDVRMEPCHIATLTLVLLSFPASHQIAGVRHHQVLFVWPALTWMLPRCDKSPFGNAQSWGGLFWLRRSYVSHVFPSQLLVICTPFASEIAQEDAWSQLAEVLPSLGDEEELALRGDAKAARHLDVEI